MLRNCQINKYKIKSANEDIKFLKEDDEYLLKESRPMGEDFIKTLNKEKMNLFVDDILTNKKITTILYASNSKLEIKTYNKSKKSFSLFREEPSAIKKKKNAVIDIIQKKIKKEACKKIVNEIEIFKLDKKLYKIDLKKRNKIKIREIKRQLAKDKKNVVDELQSNHIKGFKRAYSNIIMKLKENKEKNFSIETTKNTMINKINSLLNSDINFPDVKKNPNIVYNRLYNNLVFITPSPSTKSLKKTRPNSCYQINSPLSSKPEIILRLKNVLKSNKGKEFTVNITKDNLKKCFKKYSGGPSIVDYFKKKLKHKQNKTNNNSSTNYYKLREGKTGDTILHQSSRENYPELVQYILDKDININIKNIDGDTPLHLAARNKNNDIIKILLRNKAAIDIPNKSGEIQYDLFTPEMKKEFGIDKLLIINSKKSI